LKKYDCFGLDRDVDFMDLLFGMLEFNPLKRISPQEVLSHPFIQGGGGGGSSTKKQVLL
jgi:serine/threonine protein kinase